MTKSTGKKLELSVQRRERVRVMKMIEAEGAHLTSKQKVAVWKKYTGYGRREYFKVKAMEAKTFYGRAPMHISAVREARESGKISNEIGEIGETPEQREIAAIVKSIFGGN